MPLGETERRIYLNVSLGKVRKKALEGDSGAQRRKKEDGSYVFENVYTFVEGVLVRVYMKTHEDFGNSWQVLVDDGKDKYSLQISENSRYCSDFLRKLPNLVFGQAYKFTPYSFTPDGSDKVKTGLSIKQGGESIRDFFHDYSTDENGKPVFTPLHGFPEFEGKWDDKEEVKIYYMLVTKFLRNYAKTFVQANDVDFGDKAVTEADPNMQQGGVSP